MTARNWLLSGLVLLTAFLVFGCSSSTVTSPSDGDEAPADGDGSDRDDTPSDGDIETPPDGDKDPADGDEEKPPETCKNRCISLNRDIIDFGPVMPGTCSELSLEISSAGLSTIRIYNVGLSASETSEEFSITGFDPEEPPMDLKPGYMLNVTVRYCPIDLKDDSGLLFIATDSEFQQQQRVDVELTMGFKGSALLDVTPDEIDWGDIVADGANVPKAFVIRADPQHPEDNRPLEVLSFEFSTENSAFALPDNQGSCQPPFYIENGSEKTCYVMIAPSAAGSYLDSLNIEASDYKLPLQSESIVLSATGILGTIELEKTNIGFDYILIGESASESLTVSNTGSGPLTVDAIDWADPGAGDFSVTEGDPALFGQVIPAGETRTIDINFTPSYEGAAQATLRIKSDDGQNPMAEVLISGIGATECPLGYAPDDEDPARCVPSCTPPEKLCTYTAEGWGWRECLSEDGTLGDFNACPRGDKCEDGECVAVPCAPGEFRCLDLNHQQSCTNLSEWGEPVECVTIDPCKPMQCRNRMCDEYFANEGDPCELANKCKENTRCNAFGVCIGTTIDCDDDEDCTNDSCDPAVGCLNQPDDANDCDDGNPCTSGDHCEGGLCLPGPDEESCDDDDVCTDDTCTLEDGCQHSYNTDPCDDDNPCTKNDTCTQGLCMGEPVDGEVFCADENQCTRDYCTNPGGCQHAFRQGYCDDDDPCTINDYCDTEMGVPTCVSGRRKDCPNTNPCVEAGCDDQGECLYTNLPDGTSCSDQNICTGGESDGITPDQCQGGVCVPGTENDCEDGNVCTTNYCDQTNGCQFYNNSDPCDDDDPCTLNDRCDGAGNCDGTPVDDRTYCNDNNVCTTDQCISDEGGCVRTPVVDGSECNDNNKCTINDQCTTGDCAGTPVEPATYCDDDDPCTEDTCDPATGCKHTFKSGLSCNDGNPCTIQDTCDAFGSCSGRAMTPAEEQSMCNDDDACTRDYCSSTSGCNHTKLSGTQYSCDDGNACTISDYCSAGNCVGNAVNPVTYCSDGNTCTDDSCDPDSGCVNAPREGGCDDGNICTIGDTCVVEGDTAHCESGSTRNTCDDGNQCTSNICTDFVGCSNPSRNGQSCDDDDPCTLNDTCSGTLCISGPVDDCDDGIQCTRDECIEGVGCSNPNDNSLSCSDGSACTSGDHCSDGECIGYAIDCDDDKECTENLCDDLLGCQNPPRTGESCTDDGNECTADTCNASGNCMHPILTGQACTDDGNFCTDDVCNAAAECTHPNANKACDDNDACTSGDWCVDKACVGAEVQCEDGNICTDNWCVSDDFDGDPCHVANNTAPCDDGEFCTAGDTCQGGSCQTGTQETCSGQCKTGVCFEDSNSCQPVANGTACDDGSANTVEDSCFNGECTGVTTFQSAGPCPNPNPEIIDTTNMRKVPGSRWCIDTYEGSAWSSADCSGTQYGNGSDDYPIANDGTGATPVYACTVPGVKPSRHLTWYQAKRICENMGKSLCTRSVWETGCDGGTGWTFPYGNDYNSSTCETNASTPSNTGSHTGCVSQYGVYDPSGNVWEWLNDTSRSGYRNIGGGGYDDGGLAIHNDVNCTAGEDTGVNDTNDDLGFRCCLRFPD